NGGQRRAAPCPIATSELHLCPPYNCHWRYVRHAALHSGFPTMHERAYRQRLEADIQRWQADGLITAGIADAIRNSLRPVPQGITIAGVVAIVGGLLIAAAFLAFVASNWTAIARPMRFAILVVGILAAYGIGAWFDRNGRTYIADLC